MLIKKFCNFIECKENISSGDCAGCKALRFYEFLSDNKFLVCKKCLGTIEYSEYKSVTNKDKNFSLMIGICNRCGNISVLNKKNKGENK